MPFDVEMPDGTIIADVPDGTPKEVIRQKWVKSLGYSPTEGMGAGERALAGVGKAFVDLGRGAGQLVGAVSNQDVADARALDAPLMQTTAGKVGNFGGNVAAAIPAAFVPGANTVAGAAVIGGGLGLLQPAQSMGERAMNTGVGLALGAAGQKIGQVAGAKLGQWSANRAAEAANKQAANSVRDATMAEARRLGFKVPPATINPESTVAAAAESVAGKAATQQVAAFRNQQLVDDLIRSDLGMARGAPITDKTLAAVRANQGKIYEAVSRSGRITPDNQYLTDIANLGSVIDDVAKDFPGAKAPSADKIRELADSLFQPDFDARTAIKYVRTLREQAKSNFKAVNSAQGGAETLSLARAQQEAAGALEDMVLRNLRANGKGALADSFEKARTIIAKAHDAEQALNEGTGNIVATKLGAMLRRGKPLGGNFEKVAKFAEAAPKAFAQTTASPRVSAASAMLGMGTGLGGTLMGHPEALAITALPVARGVVRNTILSRPAQALAAPGYAPNNALLQLMQRLAPLSAPVAIGVGNSKQ